MCFECKKSVFTIKISGYQQTASPKTKLKAIADVKLLLTHKIVLKISAGLQYS